MSDTPKTDAHYFVRSTSEGTVGLGMSSDFIEFARQLERRITELEAGLRELTQTFISHVDGRDLLEELHPNQWHYCNIKVRRDGAWYEYEGDWLKRTYMARNKARALLAGKE